MRHAYPFRRQIRKGAADSRVCDGHPPVARHDAALLQRFLLARRRRDEAAARAAWCELVELNFDRVVTLVRLESRGRLSAEERDDAVQRALITMLTRFMDTFRGTSMGEWVAATRTLVHFACVDTQRRAATVSGRTEELSDHAEPEVAEEHDALLERGAAFLDWALPQLAQRRREVVELDLEELTTDAIAQRLGVSRDAVYAARSRALKDLAKLREEFEA
jgi:RNA polymerase sigma factor (sigma-70 family)